MSSNETLPGLVIADSFPVMQWALQRYFSEECDCGAGGGRR